MAFDPKNQLTYTSMFAAAARATNNTASTGVDLKGYTGVCAVRVNIGVLTAGDNNSSYTVTLQSAPNNSASDGAIASVTTIPASANVAMGVAANNTASTGTILFDPRGCFRYLFARLVITGANSPSAPLSAELVGIKQVQP